jgi:hypothetical protein
MTTDPDDWHQILSRVTGELVRGEQRVSTRELITVHLKVRETDHSYRRLKNIMRDLGWQGPKLMRWGKQCLSGYWRHPTVGAAQPSSPDDHPACAQLAPVTVDRSLVVDGNVLAEGVPREMANELEEVTRLALRKIAQILQLPTDRTDGNVLRAQTSAAATAINAQLRADEARLRQKSEGDILDRLLKTVEAEKRRLAEEDEKRRQAGKNDVDLVHIDNRPSESETF